MGGWKILTTGVAQIPPTFTHQCGAGRTEKELSPHMVCTLHVHCGQISGQLYIFYVIYVFHMSVWYKSKHTIVFTPTYVESHTFNVHSYMCNQSSVYLLVA